MNISIRSELYNRRFFILSKKESSIILFIRQVSWILDSFGPKSGPNLK